MAAVGSHDITGFGGAEDHITNRTPTIFERKSFGAKGMIDEKEKKIIESMLTQIKHLKSIKKTGNIKITVELNMSQGNIGSANIENRNKEIIFQA